MLKVTYLHAAYGTHMLRMRINRFSALVGARRWRQVSMLCFYIYMGKLVGSHPVNSLFLDNRFTHAVCGMGEEQAYIKGGQSGGK